MAGMRCDVILWFIKPLCHTEGPSKPHEVKNIPTQTNRKSFNTKHDAENLKPQADLMSLNLLHRLTPKRAFLKSDFPAEILDILKTFRIEI